MKIDEIKELIKLRKTLLAIKKLEELEKDLENCKEFYNELKNLVRDQGRSNVISKELIEELIVKYGETFK